MILEVADLDFERRVRTSFARQGLTATIGRRFEAWPPGRWRSRCRSAAGSVNSTASSTAVGAIGRSACGLR